jgi:hypothetical protein
MFYKDVAPMALETAGGCAGLACRWKPTHLAPGDENCRFQNQIWMDDCRRKSGGGPPQSKTLARFPTISEPRKASWNAPALWRLRSDQS